LKITKEGYPIIITIAVAMVISFLIHWVILGKIILLFLLFSIYFFRDPERFSPIAENCLVSPADGKLIEIKKIFSESLNRECYKISIFMSIFDVHINRLPFKGKIVKKFYHKGKFFNASLDKASEHNEKMTYIIQSDNFEYKVTQIAGLIARRIVSYVNESDILDTGEKIGLIRFGSRAEVEIPVDIIDINVSVNQQVYGGETILGFLKIG
jgi:phosphatidylserine decarboxylase